MVKEMWSVPAHGDSVAEPELDGAPGAGHFGDAKVYRVWTMICGIGSLVVRQWTKPGDYRSV